MKKILFFELAICLGSFLYAQQLHLTQFATLTHNDTVTGQWYGAGAFQSAYNAAVAGDIITLSPGDFNAVTLFEKAITIHGAGMMADEVAQTGATKINNRFVINVPNGEYHLTMEGVCLTADNVIYATAYNPHFNKCRFANTFRRADWGDGLRLAIFTNCIIGAWDGSSHSTNAMFINSIILNSLSGSSDCMYYSSGYINCCNSPTHPRGVSYDVYYNCIINITPTLTNNKRNIINCITYSTSTATATAATVFNTVGVTDSTNFYDTVEGHNNINIQGGLSSIFRTFTGTYTNGEDFRLTDEAAATYLGSDGTQVGIYGGSAVYNPKSTDMRIRKYSVGFYSDDNGQLKITTELEDE